MAMQQAPDRTGEMRTLNIAQFETSGFPARIVGPSYWLPVVLAERTLDNGTVLPARTLRTERAPVVSLRTTLEGETFHRLSDENLDYRFMAPRAKAVVGIDTDEDGVILSTQDVIDLAVNESKAFLASRVGTATPVIAGDDLPL